MHVLSNIRTYFILFIPKQSEYKVFTLCCNLYHRCDTSKVILSKYLFIVYDHSVQSYYKFLRNKVKESDVKNCIPCPILFYLKWDFFCIYSYQGNFYFLKFCFVFVVLPFGCLPIYNPYLQTQWNWVVLWCILIFKSNFQMPFLLSLLHQN